MLIYKLSTGDKVYRYSKSIVVRFKDNRKVLSTSHINGGYREDLEAVYNFDSNSDEGKQFCMRTDSYEEDLKYIAKELNLNPFTTAGISTAVSMDNVAIRSSTYEDLTVTAIVTAGIEGNAGRVGDPASFHEREGEPIMIKDGTINIILIIDACLPPGTLARTMVTCTEAKTAALQELMARSMFSRGLATGSGTDETIIICNSKSHKQLKFAGKHSKLGELIGTTVKEAVKEGLFLQTGLNAIRQHNVFRRIEGFGINKQKLWECYNNKENESQNNTEEKFNRGLELIQKDAQLVILSSLYAHLIDQLDWHLISPEETAKEATQIINQISQRYKLEFDCRIHKETMDETFLSMQGNFIKVMTQIIIKGTVYR